MATAKRDYYEVLGVSRTATDEELKKAYRKLAQIHHPDKNRDDKSAEDKFKELGEAYEALSNPEKRAAYDRYGHAAFDPRSGRGATAGGGFHDPFEVFREVFGNNQNGIFGSIFEEAFGGSSGDGRGGKGRGADLRYDLEITFEESAHGCEKEISFQKLDTCVSCDGSGAEPGSKTSDLWLLRRSRPGGNHARIFHRSPRPVPVATAPAESLSGSARAAAVRVAPNSSAKSRSRSRPALKTAHGCARAGKARAASMALRQAIYTWWSMSKNTTCFSGKATIYFAMSPSASPRRHWAARSRFRRWMVPPA